VQKTVTKHALMVTGYNAKVDVSLQPEKQTAIGKRREPATFGNLLDAGLELLWGLLARSRRR